MQRTGCPYPKPPRSKMDWIEWIDAKEKLPEKDTKVLVFLGIYGDALEDTEIGYYDPDSGTPNGWRSEEYIPLGVTHWMPLPTPPKES